MKKHRTTILLAAVFVVGMAVFLYPTAADLWNARKQSRVVESHGASVAELAHEKYAQAIDQARAHNKWLAELVHPLATIQEDEEYAGLLNVGGNGIMGTLEIEKIDVRLPIYHGISEGVLQIGVGHMAGSSLPIGGNGAHVVLTGHTGLPSSKLLTDLDMLGLGDEFTLRILGNELKYHVDQILVVEPDEIEPLMIEKERDYVTLMTCTPYGINSHRLLVRGARTGYVPDSEHNEDEGTITIVETWKVACASIPLGLLWALAARRKRKRAACVRQGRGE